MKKIMSVLLSGLFAVTLCSSTFAANTSGGLTIGMSGNEILNVADADMIKYGGKDELEISVKLPESYGSLRLVDKDIRTGDDVIKSVSFRDNKLVIKADFPTDMENPEDYELLVTLRGSKSDEEMDFTVSGTVYVQDSDGPVAPSEYREKKLVIVDFEMNDEDDIRFRGGKLYTGGLDNGIANLDVSYAESSAEKLEEKEISFVSFPASPKLEASITVGLDANEGDCIYEITGNKLSKVDAKYKDGELRFSTRRLGAYVLTDGEVDTALGTDKNANLKPWTQATQPGKPAVVNPDSTVPSHKTNPGTGAYPLEFYNGQSL